MDKNSFISDLKQSNYYNELINDEDVIMIYIGGSRLWNIIDEESDIDLCVLSKKDNINGIGRYLQYEGVKGHVYSDDIRNFFVNEKDPNKWFKNYKAILIGVLNDENIIYSNPKYDTLISYLKGNKNIFENAVYLAIKNQEKCVLSKCSLETFDNVFCKSKYLYHLLMYSYKLTGEEPDIDFVQSIKRNETNIFTDEQKENMIQRFLVLKNFYENFTPNVEEIQNEINALITLV